MTSKTRSRPPSSTTALRSALGVVLACLLLAAETFAVVHPLDLAAHSSGEPCKICVGVASLGGVASPEPHVFVVDAVTPDLPSTPPPALVSAAPVRQVARGPPSVS